MGLLDFLVPDELPYPGMPTTGNGTTLYGGVPTQAVGAQPGAAAPGNQQGFMEKVFAPADLPYPAPTAGAISGAPIVCMPLAVGQPSVPAGGTQAQAPTPPASAPSTGPTTTSPTTPSTPSGAGTTAPSAPSTSPAPPNQPATPSPVTVVINNQWPVSTSAPTAQPTDGAPSTDGSSAASGPSSGAGSAASQPNGPTTASASAVAAAAPLSPQSVSAQAQPISGTPIVQSPISGTPIVQSPISGTPIIQPPISGTPIINPPVSDPVEKRVTAFCSNPRLRARPPKAQDVYLEEVLEETVTIRMLSKDSAPVPFAVPDGCNTVELSIGPVELDPDHGEDDDLDCVVTIGELQIDGLDDDGTLTGDQVVVTAPWRYASFVELAADHLRFPIYARFYQRQLTQ
jgi:hypothetical protein